MQAGVQVPLSTRRPSKNNCSGRTVGCCRKVYNLALEARSVAWTAERRSITYVQTSAMLTQWKKTAEYSYMNEVSCVPLQQALRHLQTAFSNFFKQTGDYPRFKAKSHGGSAEYTRKRSNGCQAQRTHARQDARTIADTMVQNAAPQDGAEHRDRKSDAAGRWHVSILVEENIKRLPKKNNAIGIDLAWTATPSPATARP